MALTVIDYFSIFSVKDPAYGALGDGSHDDTSAIQNAINAAISAGGGIVFFPRGNYKITSTLVFSSATTDNVHISLVGTPSQDITNGSSITGSINGYLLDTTSGGYQAIRAIEGLAFKNSHASGKCALILNSVAAKIDRCFFQTSGSRGLVVGTQAAQTTFNTSVTNCIITGNSKVAGSIGLVMTQGVVANNRITSWDVGVTAFNAGANIIGNAFESNNTGLLLGQDDTGSDNQLQGGIVSGNSFELNATVGLYAFHIASTTVSGNAITSNVTPSTYGLRAGACTGSLFAANTVSGNYGTAGYLLEGNFTKTSFIGCFVNNTGVGATWTMPSGSNASGLTCIQCDNPSFATTFANLPASPSNGSIYVISDGATTSIGSAVSAGGSSNTYVVCRGNGGWIRIA